MNQFAVFLEENIIQFFGVTFVFKGPVSPFGDSKKRAKLDYNIVTKN